MEIVKKEEDYAIKPESIEPVIDTSTWPLLLKNYERCANPLMS